MTKTGRAVLFTMLLIAVVLMVAVSAGPSLAGKKEGRAILDRSAAFYAQLQSARVTMEVRMEMPEGFSGIPGSGPERYAIAMALPSSRTTSRPTVNCRCSSGTCCPMRHRSIS